MDRGTSWATVHGVVKNQTWLKGLSMHVTLHCLCLKHSTVPSSASDGTAAFSVAPTVGQVPHSHHLSSSPWLCKVKIIFFSHFADGETEAPQLIRWDEEPRSCSTSQVTSLLVFSQLSSPSPEPYTAWLVYHLAFIYWVPTLCGAGSQPRTHRGASLIHAVM